MPPAFAALFALVAVPLLAGSALAPEGVVKVKRTFDGDESTEFYGSSVSGAGDANNDGFADVIIGAPGYSENTGRAVLFDARREEVLHEFLGENAGDRFGFSVSDAGDLTSDGFGDVVVGAPGYDEGRGAVYLIDAKKGEIIHKLEGDDQGDLFGWSVSTAGDANNDSFADVIVGAPGKPDKKLGAKAGRAYLYDGKKAKLLHEFKPQTQDEELGWSVANAGDTNGDGFGDVIVGAPGGAEKKKKPATGVARVYHGKKGTLLHTLVGQEEGDRFGHAVHGVGDTNSSSFADVAVSSASTRGYVVVYGGKKGEELLRFESESDGERFGWSIGGEVDVDGDTFFDVIVGCPGPADGDDSTQANPRVMVFSGKEGEVLMNAEAPGKQDNWGATVSGAGDIDSDSFGEVMVGADGFGQKKGRVRILSWDD